MEGYYDPDRRAIYLHLTGAYDTAALISALETMHQQLQEKVLLMFDLFFSEKLYIKELISC